MINLPAGKSLAGNIVALLFLIMLAVAIVVLIRADSGKEAGSGTSEKAGSETVSEGESAAEVPPAQSAVYTVEYDVTWSESTHPATLPPGPHVSPIVIVSHMSENDLFASGGQATEGMEMMAETGATPVLEDEIAANPSILNSAVGTRIDAPGSKTLEITLDREHSLLSAVSMLAPSPDWFVAVNSVELFEDGRWLEGLELAVRPYDAGTDSGSTFTADDLDTSPAGIIGPPLDAAFADAAAENVFATITITKR